ncbi:hypothetical protein, partial [Alistipes putredinis]
SHRSRKWRCRCLSVARPDCGNGRLNEKESAAHPGRGKSRNLFGKRMTKKAKNSRFELLF